MSRRHEARKVGVSQGSVDAEVRVILEIDDILIHLDLSELRDVLLSLKVRYPERVKQAQAKLEEGHGT